MNEFDFDDKGNTGKTVKVSNHSRIVDYIAARSRQRDHEIPDDPDKIEEGFINSNLEGKVFQCKYDTALCSYVSDDRNDMAIHVAEHYQYDAGYDMDIKSVIGGISSTVYLYLDGDQRTKTIFAEQFKDGFD